MRSIQSQLSLWLAIVMLLLSITSGGALLMWVRHAMLDEFDRSLLVNAHALQSLVTLRPDGRLDVDVNLRSLGDFTGRSATDFFAFRDEHGLLISTSDLNGVDESPARATATGTWDTHLPNGVDARAVRANFQPALDTEHDDDDHDGDDVHATTASIASLKPMTISLVVARDRRPLDAMLLRTSVAIGAATLFFSIAAVLAALVVVRRGLASLRGLASQVAEIDVTRRERAHLDPSGRPAELVPIVQRVDDLLARMSSALLRERQFTAAVSHELRTPIAELRTAADVALIEPTDPAFMRRAVEQSQEIAIQMQTMVSTLLSIAAAERSPENAALGPVSLHAVVQRSAARRQPELSARGLTIDCQISPDTAVDANAALLTAIIDNLLGNAAQYARPGTVITICCKRAEGDRLDVIVENEHATLRREDLGHVFDPFWRKDGARSDGQHVGLGLTLVRAYCDAMGATADATLNEAGDRFCVRLRLQSAGTASQPPPMSPAGGRP